jgi:hypothetical protein
LSQLICFCGVDGQGRILYGIEQSNLSDSAEKRRLLRPVAVLDARHKKAAFPWKDAAVVGRSVPPKTTIQFFR